MKNEISHTYELGFAASFMYSIFAYSQQIFNKSNFHASYGLDISGPATAYFITRTFLTSYGPGTAAIVAATAGALDEFYQYFMHFGHASLRDAVIGGLTALVLYEIDLYFTKSVQAKI